MTYEKIIDSLEKENKRLTRELNKLQKAARKFRESAYDRVCAEEDWVNLEFAPDNEVKAISRARNSFWNADTALMNLLPENN